MLNHIRRFCTQEAPRLAVTKIPYFKPNGKEPVVICHGLLGSRQNWKSFAKGMSKRFKRSIYIPDLRNHGDSPHFSNHSTEAMVNDIISFIKQQEIRRPVLLGHSMGGKVAMALALRQPDLVSKLVVIDIAPLPIQFPDQVQHHFDGMRAIEKAQPRTQAEAYKIIADYEPDQIVQHFLLTNLKRSQSKGYYAWRVPIDTLESSVDNLKAFHVPSHLCYHGPTLFITGGISPYRKPFDDQLDKIFARFPRAQVETIPSVGHWVQVEATDKFLCLVQDFLATTDD